MLTALILLMGGVNGAWADDVYTILYGTPIYEGTAITGVNPQTDFTADDGTIATDINSSDANGDNCTNAMPIGGSVLFSGTSFSHLFEKPIKKGIVHFEANYTTTTNGQETWKIVDSNNVEIFGTTDCGWTNGNDTKNWGFCNGESLGTVFYRQARKAHNRVVLDINLTSKKVTYTVLASSGNNSYTTLTGTYNLPVTVTDVAGLTATKGTYNSYMDAVSFYNVYDDAVSEQSYSINYQLGGTTVATETGAGAVGGTVNAQSSIWDKDNTQKYFVTSDATTSFTIGEGSNEFNVAVRKAENWTLTINAALDDETNLLGLSTIPVVEGETVDYGYSQYIAVNESLYKSVQQTSNLWWGGSFTPTADGQAVNILYTDQNEKAYLCKEAEDIEGMTIVEGGNTDIRASNRKGGYGVDVLIQKVDPGVYKIKSAAYGNPGTTFIFKAGDVTVFELATSGNPELKESEEFTLYEETEITVSGGNGGNSPKVVDYVIFQRLRDATVETPTFTPAATTDELEEAFDLTLSCTTEGATIYYTIDGTEPTAESLKYEEGTSSIHIDATTTIKAIAILGTVSSVVATATYTFKAAEEPTGNVYYEKVTDSKDVTDGDYLIVYEAGNVAFNGGLNALDAVKNTISVDITEGKIASSDEIDKAVFTFDTNAMSIKSASGYYIGIKKYANGLIAAQSPAYQHDSFGIDDDGNAIICKAFSDGNMILNFNNGQNDMRFRYYKDGGQQAIQLYKKVVGGEEPPTPITVATPTFAPAETTEEFEAAFDLTMSCDTKDAVIHYTLDGTEPTTESPVYDTPINIVKTTTVKAIAIYKGVSSDLATATYTFKASEVYYEKVTFPGNITAGEYLIVYEGDNNNKAMAFDGSLKTLDATKNGIEVSISDNKIEGSDPINAATFTIDVTNGTIKSASGLYIGVSSNSNSLSTSEDATKFTNSFEIGEDDNAVISTTYNNNTKTLRYNAASDQLRFRYFGSGQQPIALYKKVTPAPVITVAAPTFSPGNGEYTEAQTVTLNCETEGATIYYTTNGDTPTVDSTPYNAEEPITVSETTTIKAIAVLNGVKSEVAEATYTIIPPVTTVDLAIKKFAPTAGTLDLSSTNHLSLGLNVVNNGETPTNDFVINYYKDDDTVPFNTIDWSSCEPLGAGKTQTLSFNLREFITTLGKYRLRAELVCENDITPGDNNLDGGFVTLYVRGDANVNGEVTTSDAVAAVSYALEKIKPDELQMLSADVDKTNTVTVADAQAIVNIALNYEFEAEARGAEAGVNHLTMENSGIGLVNTTGFSAFQMDVTLSDGAVLNAARLTERAAGMLLMTNKVGNNTWRIAALSLDGTTISGSEGALLNLDIAGQGNVSVSNVEFADRAARAYKLSFATPTAVNSLYNNKVDGEVYTVSGARSNGVKKGVNVVRRADGSVRKMLVK